MPLWARVRGRIINTWLTAVTGGAHRAVRDLGRRLSRRPRRLQLFHDLADPHSHVLIQALPRLLDRHPDVEMQFQITGPPPPDADPAPEARRAWARRDAAELARAFEVEAPPGGQEAPSPAVTAMGNEILAVSRPIREQLALAVRVGEACWREDQPALVDLADAHGASTAEEAEEAKRTGNARRRRGGHYLAGTVAWAGEWYWGIDRLGHLDERLGSPSATAPPLLPRRRPGLTADRLATEEGPLPLDFWFSFRSPYSYLALERTLALADRYPVDLRIRPVLPMVMRGLRVPLAKRLYIVKDAMREARRLGIPFGRICDPLGPGIDRCMAAFQVAERAGGGGDFLRSAATGIWSEALDVAHDGDLRRIVERAGVSWSEVRAGLGDDGWREAADANRAALIAAGLWGVPSYKCGGLALWGQDRLPWLEERLAARAVSSTPDAG